MAEPAWGRGSKEPPGSRKAAILLASVDQETATRLMVQMSRQDQERVALEIARLESSPAAREEREAVLNEFYSSAAAQQHVETGGLAYAKQLLEKIHPPEEVNRIVETASARVAPFRFLQKADDQDLLTFLQDEHPQTVALILAHLSPTQAAALLEGFPLKRQQEIVRRLSTMEQTSPEVIGQVEKALEQKLGGLMKQELKKTGGVDTAAGILNFVQRNTERSIMEGLVEDEPAMVEQLRRLMFTFEDMLRVNNRGVQSLLKSIETSRLSLALKTASDELKEKFFKNMSARAVENIKEEMELMGPVRLSDVEAAQTAIIDVVRQLEEQGELFVEGRGGASGMVT